MKISLALNKFLLQTNLLCINNNVLTRKSNRQYDSDGIIDLALITASEAPLVKFDVLKQTISDHQPRAVSIRKNVKPHISLSRNNNKEKIDSHSNVVNFIKPTSILNKLLK